MVAKGAPGINTLGPRQNRRHFSDDIFKCIFLNENIWISIQISLDYMLRGQIKNIPALVQIMAWRRSGDKPLSEAMMVNLPTHICITRPQWVKGLHIAAPQIWIRKPLMFNHNLIGATWKSWERYNRVSLYLGMKRAEYLYDLYS